MFVLKEAALTDCHLPGLLETEHFKNYSATSLPLNIAGVRGS